MRDALCEKQVAALTGVSIHTLRAGRYRSNIDVPPHIKVRGRVYYLAEPLAIWAACRGIALTGPRQRTEDP
jgi:hypothetical protein